MNRLLQASRYLVLTGNYGSGKTELALNLAMQFSEQEQTTLVDLDIVNPYFRSGEKAEEMKAAGVRMLMPTYAMTTVDIPALPAEIQSVFEVPSDRVIFDVGGDPAGALSLARYRMDFDTLEPGQLEVYDIINIRRPMSETPEKILKLKSDMEGFARQTVTGFIHNSNLQDWASAQDLIDGYPVVRAASEMSGIPVVYTTARKDFLDEFLREESLDRQYIGTPLALELYMHRSWNNFAR